MLFHRELCEIINSRKHHFEQATDHELVSALRQLEGLHNDIMALAERLHVPLGDVDEEVCGVGWTVRHEITRRLGNRDVDTLERLLATTS